MAQMTRIIALLLIAFLFLFLLGCPAPPEPEVVNITPVVKPECVTDADCPANMSCVNGTCVKVELPAQPEKPKTCEELEVGVEECIIQRALATQNFSDCRLLNGSWFDLCVLRFAERDFNYCFEFVALNETNKSDDCLLNVSAIHGEVVCGFIANATKLADCKLQFVSEGCRDIANESERYTCDAIAKRNVSICDRREVNRDLCLFRFSQKVRGVCHQIGSEVLRRACSAILFDNLAYCATNITAIADACYGIVAVEEGNCGICTKVVLTDYIDACYSDCAQATRNVGACAGAVTELVRDKCYYAVAIATLNASACDKIILKGLRINCIFKIARAAAEPAICEKLDVRISDCYYQAILQPTITKEACSRMAPSYDRDLCFMEVVRYTQDKGVCELIADSALREYCKR